MSQPTPESGKPQSAAAASTAPADPIVVAQAEPAEKTSEPAEKAPVAAQEAAPAPAQPAVIPVSTPVASEPATASTEAVPTPAVVATAPVAKEPVAEPTPTAALTPVAAAELVEPAVIVKRSKAAPVFAVLAVLFLIAAVGAGALYYTNKQKSDKQITDQATQIQQLNDTVKTKDEALAKAQADATQAKTTADALTAKNQSYSACIKAIQAVGSAVSSGDGAALNTATTQVLALCGNLQP